MSANWVKKPNMPKLWRINATAPDGVTVTLGRYETEAQALAERDSFAEQGRYRHLVVQPIEPPPEAASDETPAS